MSNLFYKFKSLIQSYRLQNQLKQASSSLLLPRSVIFFTTHKCASTFVGRLFDLLLKNSDYEHIDYAKAISFTGNKLNIVSPYENFLEQVYSNIYSPNGKIYGPQRRPLNFPGREKFKHIFFLRDPRDVLVSSYYSFAYTHSSPKNIYERERFIKNRDCYQEQGIDDYVLEQAETWIVPTYKSYIDLRESSEQSIYLKYDDFVQDTENFVKAIAYFCDLHIEDRNIKKLVTESNPIQSNETLSHKRSGRSKQYLEKLSEVTQKHLNKILEEILYYWSFN